MICSSKKLREYCIQCKYQNINEIAVLNERDHIISGTEYKMDDIKLNISHSGKAQCFDKFSLQIKGNVF